MTRLTLRALGALFVLCIVTSCTFMRRQAFAPPDVLVSDVRLTGIGAQGGNIDIVLSIHNRNNYRLDASAVRYRVMVDSIKLAEGTVKHRVTLLKKDSTKVRLPVTFGFREVLAVGRRLAQTGSLPFDLVGNVKVETPFGDMMRAFNERGTYDGLNISILPRRH